MALRTALVVEDDKNIQQMLKDHLEAEGFSVLCEKDGEWALKSLERRLPNVMITDVLLPAVSGFELVEALRAMPGGSHVPVVMMSGIYRGRRHKKMAKDDLDVAAYLDKPFDLSDLTGALKDALGDEYPGRRPHKPRKQKRAAYGDDPFADVLQKREQDEVERTAGSLSGAKAARGNLRHKPFPEVLAQLHRWRASGALLLRKERVKKIVYLKEGYPTFVKSNLLSECLGRVLVREKIISEEECEQSIRLMKKRGRQQGTILIEMGAISPHNLVYGLQLQLQEKLFDIFGWTDGDYQFSTKIDIPPQAVALDMSLATIIYEGVRRTHRAPELEDRLGPFMDSYLQVHDDPLHRFQSVPLEADERKLVALIDGRRTLRDVIDKSGLDRLVALQLVYALFAAEMIQPSAKRSRRAESLDAQPPVMPPPSSAAADRPPPLKKAKRPPAAPPPRDDPRRRGLSDRLAAMTTMNHFEVLGVSRDARPEEIRRAYHAGVRELHPDKFRGQVPAALRDLAAQIVARVTAAYNVLSDADARERYETELSEAQKPKAHDDVARILAAEGRFRRGDHALSRGDFDAAVGLFEEAVELYPEEGEFFAHLGWARFKAGAPPDDVRPLLEQGVSKDPQSYKSHLFLGFVDKAAGKDATAHFERALQCDPDGQEALAELKLTQRS